jgi:hypothetical protein
MSWGFGVGCTLQSGYQHESIFELSTTDLNQNLRTIDLMQTIDEEILVKMQQNNLRLLKTKYSSQLFQKKLLKL